LVYHTAMRIHVPSAASLSLVAALLLATPAVAQSAGGVVTSGSDQRELIAPGFAEAAVASCAGGAMIGYLAVLATGAATPVGTAALFCGLSVAATAASTITAWTWHKTTSFLY
jgi:hypothetical protein